MSKTLKNVEKHLKMSNNIKKCGKTSKKFE
jgi:hypothetical protein